MQKPRYVVLRRLFLVDVFVMAPVVFGIVYYFTGDFWLAAAAAYLLAFFGMAGFIYFCKRDSRNNGMMPSDFYHMTPTQE